MRKFLVDFVGLVSGVLTILVLFIDPDSIASYLGQIFNFPVVLGLITAYAKFVVVIPLVTGVVKAHAYGGFSFPRLFFDPLHLISSFVMFEFWHGVRSGLTFFGYLVIPFGVAFIIQNLIR